MVVSNVKPEESDVLRGMKEICTFLKMSEPTVLKWNREYDNFPMKKNGGFISSRKRLNEWFRWYLENG